MAMGGAFAGLADDFTAVYWNPAGLAQMRPARDQRRLPAQRPAEPGRRRIRDTDREQCHRRREQHPLRQPGLRLSGARVPGESRAGGGLQPGQGLRLGPRLPPGAGGPGCGRGRPRRQPRLRRQLPPRGRAGHHLRGRRHRREPLGLRWRHPQPHRRRGRVDLGVRLHRHGGLLLREPLHRARGLRRRLRHDLDRHPRRHGAHPPGRPAAAPRRHHGPPVPRTRSATPGGPRPNHTSAPSNPTTGSLWRRRARSSRAATESPCPSPSDSASPAGPCHR